MKNWWVSVLTVTNANPAMTPLDYAVKLSPLSDDELRSVIQVPYAVAIGSLMYASVGSRPDISFAVQTLSQFTSRPSQTHWTAIKHVMRYLKATRDLGLIYGASGNLALTGYSDAD